MPLVVDVRAVSLSGLATLAGICAIVMSSTLAVYAFAANRARAFLRSTRAMRFAQRAAGGLLAGVAVTVATR